MQNGSKPLGKQTSAFLGVASGLGQPLSGVELAPRFLRDSGFFQFHSVTDLGDIVPNLAATDLKMEAWSVIERVEKQASKAIARGDSLFVLGGDHSIAAGSVFASLRQNPETRVVWIDAHGDMNTPKSSPSGNIHGMPLAVLLGLFEAPINGPHLRPENLLLVGVRDLDPGEKVFIANHGIEVVTAVDVRADLSGARKTIAKWLSLAETPVHLSFDVDAIDPADAPATGIAVPDGLSVNDARLIVRTINENSVMTVFDLVELNPSVSSQTEVQETLENLRLILSEVPFVAAMLAPAEREAQTRLAAL